MANPEEKALAWRDLGEGNIDHKFLFPETDDSKRPSNNNFRKHTTEQAAEYMRWIQERIPTIDKKDKRVYCPYCNMKNHPCWTCYHQAFLHFVRLRSPSIPLPTCYAQQRHCET